MGSRVAIRTPHTTGCFHSTDFRWTLKKHDAAVLVKWAMDGLMKYAFIQDSFLSNRMKLKRITQYGSILNFPSGNKALRNHTRDSSASWQSPPPLLRKHIGVANLLLLQNWSWNLCCDMRKGTQMCPTGIWNLWICFFLFLNKCWCDRRHKYDPSPQSTI